MVTHDAFTASYAHRILFIKDGKIFSELIRGKDSRKEFFNRIIEVITLLGGMTTMYSKIAVGNVKKSFKDYTIYFLTLTLAVCIFYSFNSIEAQKVFIDMKASGKEYADSLVQIIAYISVFVSVILGSLILYANNFLIKKRKKELGICMTLGMGKRKISRILIIETLLVGAISLISGLLLGIVASQGLSLFTSKLFDIPMSGYSFVISASSVLKTILYFSIMFFLVMIFNKEKLSKLRFHISFMKLSDYNKIMKLEHKNEVSLKEDEALLLRNIYEINVIEDYLKNNSYIEINNKKFNIKGGKVINNL